MYCYKRRVSKRKTLFAQPNNYSIFLIYVRYVQYNIQIRLSQISHIYQFSKMFVDLKATKSRRFLFPSNTFSPRILIVIKLRSSTVPLIRSIHCNDHERSSVDKLNFSGARTIWRGCGLARFARKLLSPLVVSACTAWDLHLGRYSTMVDPEGKGPWFTAETPPVSRGWWPLSKQNILSEFNCGWGALDIHTLHVPRRVQQYRRDPEPCTGSQHVLRRRGEINLPRDKHWRESPVSSSSWFCLDCLAGY